MNAASQYTLRCKILPIDGKKCCKRKINTTQRCEHAHKFHTMRVMET